MDTNLYEMCLHNMVKAITVVLTDWEHTRANEEHCTTSLVKSPAQALIQDSTATLNSSSPVTGGYALTRAMPKRLLRAWQHEPALNPTACLRRQAWPRLRQHARAILALASFLRTPAVVYALLPVSPQSVCYHFSVVARPPLITRSCCQVLAAGSSVTSSALSADSHGSQAGRVLRPGTHTGRGRSPLLLDGRRIFPNVLTPKLRSRQISSVCALKGCCSRREAMPRSSMRPTSRLDRLWQSR